METDLHPDASLIDRLGGPTTVAELMGIRDVRGAVQRVSNWKRRGIPSSVRLEFPNLFQAVGALPDVASMNVRSGQPAGRAGHV